MDTHHVVWVMSLFFTLCSSTTSDTSDRKASMNYMVHSVPTFDDPFDDVDLALVKRAMIDDKELWDIMDPDRPLQRNKRIDDSIDTFRRRKREISEHRLLKRVKREQPLERVKRETVEKNNDGASSRQEKLQRIQRKKRSAKQADLTKKMEKGKINSAKIRNEGN